MNLVLLQPLPIPPVQNFEETGDYPVRGDGCEDGEPEV